MLVPSGSPSRQPPCRRLGATPPLPPRHMPALDRMRTRARSALRAAALRRFAADTQGATTAEYGLICVVMAAVGLAAMRNLDGSLATLFSRASTNVASAVTAATGGNSGTSPGQTGSTPGQSGSTPGQSGDAPGQGGTPPGQTGSTPGQGGGTPGNGGGTPGNGGGTPGNGGGNGGGRRN